MITIPGRIPITIHPTFWLTAALIGYLNSMSFIGTLIWIGIIFVSILVHEFGHALTGLIFKQSPRIELVALGGLTYQDSGKPLPFWKQFFIVLDGPLFGFFLFIIATILLQFPLFATGITGAIVKTFQGVNLFWTILNLMPVMPLDGGQLLRVILEGFFGAKGVKYALMASMGVGVALSLVFFLYQAFLIGALFFLLAFQSYDTWRRTRLLSDDDRSENLKSAFEMAEEAFLTGRKDEAVAGFENIRQKSHQGMLYVLSTQYLAFLRYEQGKGHEAYDLLLSVRKDLAPDALCLLHRAAFEQKNYPLVVEIGGDCFQTLPSAEAALRNAYACANLRQARPAVGWLQTALKEGLENLQQVIAESSFDPIRSDPEFQEFLKSL